MAVLPLSQKDRDGSHGYTALSGTPRTAAGRNPDGRYGAGLLHGAWRAQGGRFRWLQRRRDPSFRGWRLPDQQPQHGGGAEPRASCPTWRWTSLVCVRTSPRLSPRFALRCGSGPTSTRKSFAGCSALPSETARSFQPCGWRFLYRDRSARFERPFNHQSKERKPLERR